MRRHPNVPSRRSPHIMHLLDKIRERKFWAIGMTPNVYCKVGEDSLGSLELICLPELKLHTKHTNACYHHFQKHVGSRKFQTFLPPNQLDVIADNVHLGCGFIHLSFLVQLIGNSQLAHRGFAIQVRIIGPSSFDIAEDMLIAKRKYGRI